MGEDVEIEVKEDEKDVTTTKDDKDKEGPPKGSERWEKIYWEAQEGKRAREERDMLKTQLVANTKLIEEMGTHNKLLTEAVNKIAGAVDNKTAASDVDKIEDKISELRADKRIAREKADFAAEDRIDEELTDLRFKLREVKSKPVDIKTKVETKEAPLKNTDEELSAEEKTIYDSWIDENEWFTKNPKMRKAAIEAEKTIRANPDYEYATTDEILKGVKIHVETKFKGIDTGGIDLVAGTSSTGAGTGGVKVKVNPIELEIAKGFGISPQAVARQKMLIEQAKSNKARR